MRASITVSFAGALALLGCGGPTASKPVAPSTGVKPTMVTRAATPYGEVELAAIVRVNGTDVKLFDPNGEPYTGEMPDRFSLENLTLLQDLTKDESEQVGLCFRYPDGFPATTDGPQVFLDGKSASYYRLGPRLDGEASGKFAFALVGGKFDGRPIVVSIPLKPESMVAKGSWPIEGTVSVAGVGTLTQIKPKEEGQSFSLALNLKNAFPDEHFEVRVFDGSGEALTMRSSGSQLNPSGHPTSYWWHIEHPEKGTRYEVWMGKAVSVEFSGVSVK